MAKLHSLLLGLCLLALAVIGLTTDMFRHQDGAWQLIIAYIVGSVLMLGSSIYEYVHDYRITTRTRLADQPQPLEITSPGSRGLFIPEPLEKK